MKASALLRVAVAELRRSGIERDRAISERLKEIANLAEQQEKDADFVRRKFFDARQAMYASDSPDDIRRRINEIYSDIVTV